MGDVTGHDDGTLQVHSGRNGILRQFLAHSIDTLVEVDLDGVLSLTGLGILCRDKLRRVRVHLLQPDTVGIDLRLDISVSRTTDTHTDRTTCTMTRQTDHTDVVSQILTTKLGTQTDLLSLLEEFLLEIDITEGTTCLITCRRQTIVELDGSQFDGEEVLLSRCTANHEGNVIGRTGSCAEALHLLHEERDERTLVLNRGLRHGIEVGLVSRTTTLGDKHELILCTLRSLDVDLGREVTTGVHLVVHVQRGILRVAQVVLGEGIEDTQAQGLLVLETGPHLLTLLTVDDCRTRILTERQDATGSHLGIAQELQGHILVIL